MIGEEELVQMARQLADQMDQAKHWRGSYIAAVEDLERLAPEIDTLRARVAELEAERRWVPMSERVPKSYDYGLLDFVRVTVMGYDDETGDECRHIVDAEYVNRSGKWYDSDGDLLARDYLGEVVAWMPNPKPYGGER